LSLADVPAKGSAPREVEAGFKCRFLKRVRP